MSYPDHGRKAVQDVRVWFEEHVGDAGTLDETQEASGAAIELRMSANDHPAAAQLRMQLNSEWFSLWAGKYFRLENLPYQDTRPTTYCAAVFQGNLIEMELIEDGRIVAWSADMELAGSRVRQSEKLSRLVGVGGWLSTHLNRGQWRCVRPYSPYFELARWKDRPEAFERVKPPLVLDSDQDLAVFRSSRHLQGYLEPNDVLDTDYVLYDCSGHELSLSVEGPEQQNELKVVVVSGVHTRDAEARSALLRYLVPFNISAADVVDESVEDLAIRALEHHMAG